MTTQMCDCDRVQLLVHERKPERQEAERDRKVVGGLLVLGDEFLSERDVTLLNIGNAEIRVSTVNGFALALRVVKRCSGGSSPSPQTRASWRPAGGAHTGPASS